MKRKTLMVMFSLAFIWHVSASLADELLMARSAMPFAETMLVLHYTIREHGYQLSRVQRVDIGFTQFGYESNKYRVVFFGKPDEVQALST